MRLRRARAAGMAIAADPQFVERAVIALIVALFCSVAVLVTLTGSPLVTLGLAALILIPYGLYVALARPLSFPFGLYVLLIPFDNLLATGAFGTITKLLGILAGIFLLLWTVRRRAARPMSRSTGVLLAIVVWMLLSALWSLDQRTALDSMATYAGLFVLYAVVAIVPISVAEFRTLLGVVVAGGLVAAGYGIHVFYHDPSLASGADRLVIQAGSTTIDPNHFSNALLFPLAIVMMATLRGRRLLPTLVGVGGVAIFTVAILLSGSREALVGLLLIFVTYLVRSRYRLKLVLAITTILLIATTVQTSIWTRFSHVLETGGDGRSSIWSVALEAAKHRPVLGYGIGNFQSAYNLYYISVPQSYRYGWSSPAHSLVLHYLVELGIIGLVLVVLFFWTELRSLRCIERSSDLRDYRVLMESSLIAIAFVSLTIDLFTYKYAWLVFSMIAFLRNAAAAAEADADQRRRRSVPPVPS